MEQKEIWKPVVGYEGLYEVSNLGRIKSLLRNNLRILKGSFDKDGYLSVILCKNRSHKRVKVHRVVADAFIPNPNGYPMINHKDEVKSNNNLDNLEWCTAKYNSNYGTHKEQIRNYAMYHGKKLRKVKQYDLDGNFIQEFISSRMAERFTGIKHQNIIEVCRKGQHTAGGYRWTYSE